MGKKLFVRLAVKVIMSFIAFAFANHAFAQETWNDLKFGTSMTEVRDSLSKKGLTLQRSGKEWQVMPEWDLQLPGLTKAFHFEPRLFFSETDRLERVTLDLLVTQHRAEHMDPPVLTSLTAKYIHQALVAKYGSPVSQAGICENVSVTNLIGGPGKLSCAALWKSQGQTITLDWSYYESSGGRLLFSVTYLASQKSGL
jgi:hypothetical protein